MTKGRLTRAAAIILTVAALFLLASCGFSYEKSKLKKYVKLAREDYYGVSVSIPAAKEVTEADIDLEIDTFRLELRTLVSEGELTTHAQWGDSANTYFIMTVEGEGGGFLPPSSYSNMTDTAPHGFILGGGILPKAFEDDMTDRAAIETNFVPLTEATETVAAGDVIYLDLSYRYTDGEDVSEGTTAGARIDLSANAVAAAAFAGLHPGDEFDFGLSTGDPLTFDWDGDGATETLAAAGIVKTVSRGEVLARVETVVEADFYDTLLAGKRVTLLYAIQTVDVYSVPEITEELLSENVPEFTHEEGADLNTEFRDYVRQLLTNEARREWHATIEQELWNRFDSLDCIKKYPGDAIRDELREQEKQLERLYEHYGAALEEEYGVNPFSTVEEFGAAYYELDKTNYSDVHEYLKKEVVPHTVKQKLIIYYIAEQEGWKCTEEEYEAELPQQLTYYAQSEGVTTAEVFAKYGESFFRQAIQYNKVLTHLVDVTLIVE